MHVKISSLSDIDSKLFPLLCSTFPNNCHYMYVNGSNFSSALTEKKFNLV